MVFRRARGILGSESDAHDIVQEVFLGMMDRTEAAFEGRSSMTTWLYSVTTNLCLNRIRDGRNRSRLIAENVVPLRATTDEGSSESRSIVHDLLRKLPEDLRAAAVHYYLDEMTHEEIAAQLSCSRRHVGNLVERLADIVKEMETQ